MSEKEINVRLMAERLKKLPAVVQERVGYIIEGAALVHGSAEMQNRTEDSEQKGA